MHREAKLGEETIKKLKGTSLDRADELDQLIALNRGAPSGTLTPTVQNLVDAAVRGEMVSALAQGGNRKAPSLQDAWKKRMAHAWAAASEDERYKFADFIQNLCLKGGNRE
jgi:hypothetical protein